MHETGKVYKLFDEYSVEISPGGTAIHAYDGSFNLLCGRNTGKTWKWGKTVEENPTHCPWGPEIADIEITTACNGIRDKAGNRAPCMFCYKSNSASGTYMSFDKFKEVLDRMVKAHTLTQVALGVDAQARTNPDLEKILAYCLYHGVVPNITVADIDQPTAELLVKYCGAIAVSWYPLRNAQACYDSLKLLNDEKVKQNKSTQLNIHALLCLETLPFFDELFAKLEGELKDIVRATVLLSLKKKGRGGSRHRANQEQFNMLIDRFIEKRLVFGMDSCGANKFLKWIELHPGKEGFKQMIESCESTLFSSYINVHGEFFPCSFMEGEAGWEEGIQVCDYDDFSVVWHHPQVEEWRKRALWCIGCKGSNECPYWEV